jgi:hypothetical protein
MNPVLALALNEVLAKLSDATVAVLLLAAKDLAAGKSVLDTCTDIAETAAEDMVALENQALKAAGL